MMRVLIVDDSAIIRHIIDTTMENNINIIGQAVNELEAQRLYLELKPDLVVVNTVMSGLNSLEVISLIRAINGESRIMIISSSDNKNNIKEALKAGVVGYTIIHLKDNDDSFDIK